MVHDYYAEWGGEDACFEQEVTLLKQYGHDVESYTRHNDEIADYSWAKKSQLFFETTWSSRTYQELSRTIIQFRPDIVHVHNFFPLVSPSLFYLCAGARTPVVATLHNYRLLCPKALFFRDGQVCEDCLEHNSLWPSLVHRCYRNSAVQTATVAGMLQFHRTKKTWVDKVDGYIALTDFAKQKFIKGGMTDEQIYVRPNFLVKDFGVGPEKRQYAIFVGRLSPEKGVLTLLEAWRHLPNIPLKIVGDGPLRAVITEKLADSALKHVEVLGFVAPEKVMALIRGANLLIMPSEWYETFGRTIIEAFSAGTPVLASRLGAMAELVGDDCEGKLFTPGDAEDLRHQVAIMYAQPEQMMRWGKNARLKYERLYDANSAYESLSAIYRDVIRRSNAHV